MKSVLISALCLAYSLHSLAQEIPVDHYTGQPVISIPLYQLNDRGLSDGLSLIYDASGVKVDEESGIIGMNWKFLAGGEVTRELRGLPDDYYSATSKGWLHNSNASTIGNFSYSADGTGLSCATESGKHSFINGFNHIVDSEPDIFHFSAGGLSGSFVFDNTGNINNVRLIPYQDVRVTPYRSGPNELINKFDIVTASGIKYTFDVNETVNRKANNSTGSDPLFFRREYHQYKNQVSFSRAWKLSSISSAIGERITFSYSGKMLNTGSSPTPALWKADAGNYNVPFSEYYITEEVTSYYLSYISTPDQFISLTYLDLPSNELYLQKIIIQEGSGPAQSYSLAKTINFYRVSVNSTNTVEEPSVYRSFLRMISINDNCQSHDYVFEYNDVNYSNYTVNLPPTGSKHQDIWGYYFANAAANKTPRLYVYPSQTGIHKVSLYQKTGQGDEIVIPGADRLNTATSTIGALAKITYPTGAVVSLAYQPHQFFNPIINSASQGGGLRILSIRMHDAISNSNDIIKTYEYTKTDGSTSGKILSMPTFWELAGCYKDPTTSAISEYPALSSLSAAEQWKRLLVRSEHNLNQDASSIVYERVTEKISTGKGKTVYNFDVPFTFGAAASGDWNPTYTHIARSSACPSSALSTPDFYSSPYSPQTPYDFARGLLMSVAHYAENDNNPLKETIYEYQDKPISPVTVKGLRYQFIPQSASGYYFAYGAYTLSTNKLKVLFRTKERTRDRLTSTSYVETITDYTYATDHSMIATAEVTNSDGSLLRQRFKYVKDYGTPGAATSDLQVNMIDALYNAGQTGVLVEQTSSVTPAGQPEKTQQGTLHLFENFGTTLLPVIRAKEVLTLRTNGITSFGMSSYTGSGSSRVFSKNGAYKKTASFKYTPSGNLYRTEDEQRQVTGNHPSIRTGAPVAVIANAEAGEVIYSAFDHETDFDFDQINFPSTDLTSDARTGAYGLKGWTSGSGKYLKKQFIKRPGSRYTFSAWYKPAVTSGTHALEVKIKNTSNAQLLSQTVNYTITSSDWHYAEALVDLSSIATADVIVEVYFAGSYSSSSTSVTDDVLFAPEGTLINRYTYQKGSVSSVTAPDGTIASTEFDLSGRVKYVRDHDNNIVQRNSYTNYSADAQSGSPVSFTSPSLIYDGDNAVFDAHLGCVETSSIAWKVTTTGNPSGGTFITGTSQFSYAFPSAGSYIVTLKVSHSSYGSYETSQTVQVVYKPLTVSLCVTMGVVDIDVCQAPPVYQYMSCYGPLNPPEEVSTASTSFSVNVSGCGGGGTYTYSWQRKDLGRTQSPWVTVGSASEVTTFNGGASYELRCVVTSSCGRTGTATTQVNIYRSTNCSGENHD